MPDAPNCLAVKVQIPRAWMPFLKQCAKSHTRQATASLIRAALIEHLQRRGFSVGTPRIDTHNCSECGCQVERRSNRQKTCLKPACVLARRKRLQVTTG